MQNSAPSINKHHSNSSVSSPKPFVLLIAAYFLTSLGHFAHNAEYLCEDPNLPIVPAIGTASTLLAPSSQM
jgi:hypothetical protein